MTMQNHKRERSVKFNIEIEGSGPPLLLVHGFPLDHAMWTSQIEALASAYQVIAPDLRGFGKSDGVERGETVTMREYARDLDGILDGLNVQTPVHLCGLSMGGYIAFEFIHQFRDRVNRLILCDTKATADTHQAQQLRQETAERVEREGTSFLAESMPQKLFSPQTLERQPQRVQQVQSIILRANPFAVAAASRGMAQRRDMQETLKSLDAPTLVIVGEDDAITTVGEMQQMAEQIPNAQFVKVPQAGHMAPMENPEVVNAAIREFLDAN